MSPAPTLYFDLASPHAYLAFERAESVLGAAPELAPVLVGAIFQWRGRGSWALTDERGARVQEIEQRARRYDLPPMVWPTDWPANSLTPMRAAIWAQQEGQGRAFAHGMFDRQFTQGADITDLDVLGSCAAAVWLDPEAMVAAIRDRAIKNRLKEVTERAWADGVRGVPSVRLGTEVFFGDDQLERAAESL